jgi:hypothetical protein
LFQDRLLTHKESKKSLTSIAVSNRSSTGIGEPRGAVKRLALSRALWSNTSNLKRRLSNLSIESICISKLEKRENRYIMHILSYILNLQDHMKIQVISNSQKLNGIECDSNYMKNPCWVSSQDFRSVTCQERTQLKMSHIII